MNRLQAPLQRRSIDAGRHQERQLVIVRRQEIRRGHIESVER